MTVPISLLIFLGSSLNAETSNILLPKSPLTPGANTIRLYYSPIAPSPDCTGMHIKQAGYFPGSQHAAHSFVMCHLLTGYQSSLGMASGSVS